MCNKETKEDPWTLEFVFDWFVRQGIVKIWHEDKDYYYDNELAQWYNGYKKMQCIKKTDRQRVITFRMVYSRRRR